MSVNSKIDSLIDALRERITSGEFGPEGRLPSFRTLATEYETTQETMNKTMQALQAEGLLVSKGAKGVFVNEARIRIPGVVVDFSRYLAKKGFKPTSSFVDNPSIITPSEEIRKLMKLKKGEKVLYRKRKQGTNVSMFRLIESYFPMSFINEKMLEQINQDPHFNIINAIKDNFDKKIQYTHEELIARVPTLDEQKELKVVRTNPVIDIKILRYTEDKKNIIVYTRKILNANLFLLTFDYPVDYWE